MVIPESHCQLSKCFAKQSIAIAKIMLLGALLLIPAVELMSLQGTGSHHSTSIPEQHWAKKAKPFVLPPIKAEWLELSSEIHNWNHPDFASQNLSELHRKHCTAVSREGCFVCLCMCTPDTHTRAQWRMAGLVPPCAVYLCRGSH